VTEPVKILRAVFVVEKPGFRETVESFLKA
jgi:hypothetical protein